MPRGKKSSPSIPSSSVALDGVVSLKDFLFRVRDICRNHGVQMDENGNMYADLIYDDLLFLREVWKLAETGALALDIETIKSGTPLTDIRLESIAALGATDPSKTSTVFRRLWLQLQRSTLKDVFAAREFGLMGLLKDDVNKAKLDPTLIAILDYTGKANIAEHEDSDPYEYFSQDLKKQKSKYFGQFYTPTNVADACVAEIAPQLGEIGMDPMGGTGKFMRAAASYIHKHNPSISAADAFANMRTMEIEPKIYRQGVIAAFTSYKRLPNMNHIRKGDSFDILVKEEEQVDFICANPPFGGTVVGFEGHYYQTSVETVGKRIKSVKNVRDSVKHTFPFVKKDTSVLALQLIVNKLKNGGRAAVIFNGTIMNNAHRDVMKWFLETCDLRKIVVIPGGTFQCTGIETYAFIFWKGTPTNKVEYYRFGESEKIGELSMETIQAKEYDIRPIFSSDNHLSSTVMYQTIEDLCFISKGNVQASKAIPGQFPIYSASAEVGTHNESPFEGEAVIYVNGSSGSKGRVHYAQPGEKFAASTLVLVLKPKDTTLSGKYLWYYLTLKKEYLLKMFESSNMRETINEADFRKCSMPVPCIEIQHEIVATLDRIYTPGTTELADTLKMTDKAMDLVLANPGGATLEPIVDAQRLIRKSAQMVADVKAQMVAIMKSSLLSKDSVIAKLGSILQHFKTGKNQNDLIDGEYPFYMANGISKSYTTYQFDGEYVLNGRCGSKLGDSCYYVNGKFSASDFTYVLQTNPAKMHNKFLYYYIKCVVDWNKYKSGTSMPNLPRGAVSDLDIVIPSLQIQTAVLYRLESLESQIKALESLQSQSEDNAQFILDSYLSTKSDSVANSVADDISEDTISHE